MAANSPGKGILFTGLASTNPITSMAFSVAQLQQASFHIRTDGSASLSYSIQATNIPDQSSEQGPPYRNDNVVSPDWAQIQTGTVASGASSSSIATVTYTPYRALRVVFTAPTGSPIVNIFAFGTGAAS